MSSIQCSCGSVLNNEDALTQHIKTVHVQEFNSINGHTCSDIYSFFKDLFPDYTLHIKTTTTNKDVYKLSFSKENSLIELKMGPPSSGFAHTPQMGAAEMLDYLFTISHIEEQIQQKYSLINFHCHSCTYGNKGPQMTFQFSLTENPEVVINEVFQPHMHPNPEKQAQYLHDFIESFQQYTVATLEGILTPVYRHHYFYGYEINGVSCNHLMGNHRIRLEIIDKGAPDIHE